ncbi:MAG: TolC family protein, partial [Bacteroidota bacterium]
LPFPPGSDPIDPLLVQPGTQLQGSGVVDVPLLAPGGWAGRRAAQRGLALAEAGAESDALAVTRRVVQAFHASAEAYAVLADAERAEALAGRLLEKGRLLAELGAVAADEVLPFERAHASARANVARAREGVVAADGVLERLTGLKGPARPGAVPDEAPPLDALLATVDRADLREADQAVDATRSAIAVARAGRLPTVGAQGSVVAVDPAPDFGATLIWRVSVGATVPVFQGGAVSGRVRQAKARAAAADAGRRALQEGAEIEIRSAHGALAQALSSLSEQQEAVRLAEAAVAAAERRVDEGGGSLLQLQQAQLEEAAAEVQRTRARSAAARAADLLDLAVAGALSG